MYHFVGMSTYIMCNVNFSKYTLNIPILQNIAVEQLKTSRKRIFMSPLRPNPTHPYHVVPKIQIIDMDDIPIFDITILSDGKFF